MIYHMHILGKPDAKGTAPTIENSEFSTKTIRGNSRQRQVAVGRITAQ